MRVATHVRFRRKIIFCTTSNVRDGFIWMDLSISTRKTAGPLQGSRTMAGKRRANRLFVARNHAAMANERTLVRVYVLVRAWTSGCVYLVYVPWREFTRKVGKLPRKPGTALEEIEREGANATRDDGICKSRHFTFLSLDLAIPPTLVPILIRSPSHL